MGIKGLTNVIQNVAPESMVQKNILDLKGKKVAIDMSLIVYQCLISFRMRNGLFKDKEGNTTSHLYGIFTRFTDYLSKGIIPIAVFDGKPPNAKKATIDSRNKGVQENKEKIEELKKLEQSLEITQEIAELEKKTVKMTWQHGVDLKQLLTLMGIKWYQANGEAEAACVWLVKNGYADTVMTEDMDALPLGAPTLVRRNVKRNSKADEITVFYLDKILEKFNLTMEQFIEMCLLCGSDYTSSIPRIGSRSAYSLMLRYNNLFEVLDVLREKPSSTPVEIPCNELYINAKKIFMSPNNDIIYPDQLEELTLTPNVEELKKYLLDKNFNEKRVDTAINKAYLII